MTKLVDVLRKIDLVEEKLRRQLVMLVELRRSLVVRALKRTYVDPNKEPSQTELYMALSQAERRDYDKMLSLLMVDTKDSEVEG